MSTALQPTVQATPLWEGPPLKPVPELPPIDASRIIDMKKYEEMVAQEDRVRYLEWKSKSDRPLILIMFSIIKKEEGIWKRPSSDIAHMMILYNKVAIELYGRTGELVAHHSIKGVWLHAKFGLRQRIVQAIERHKMSPEDMETYMWDYWLYPTARFLREKYIYLEEKLRRELSSSSRKSSLAPPTQTPPTTKRREDDSFSSTSMDPMDSPHPVEPHQNENQNQNPSSSAEIKTPKTRFDPFHRNMKLNPTSPGFRIPQPEPEVVQLEEENDMDYGNPGISNAPKRMSTAPQSNLQATPLWEGPPLKPIPKLPPLDSSRVIDVRKYEEMIAQEGRVRHLEAQNVTDRPLLLMIFSIIKKDEGLWKRPSSNCVLMTTLYKKVAIELYARTGELVTSVECRGEKSMADFCIMIGLLNYKLQKLKCLIITDRNIVDVWSKVKRTFRDRITRAIQNHKMSPEDMETYMWDLWLYPTARFYREKLMDFEEQLRRELNNSSRKRSLAPPTQTPPTTKRRKDHAVEPHQNENQNQNPSSSSESGTPKPQVLAPVKPLNLNMNLDATSLGFRIPKPEPEVILVDEDYYEVKEENDEDYGTPGIPNSPPSPTDSSIQDDYQIQLNVGGVLFSTMKSTLMKKCSWFRENLGTDYQKFIDRDFTHFRIILNYMRDGAITLPDSIQEIEEIQREAVFYEMAELVGMCMLKLTKIKKN